MGFRNIDMSALKNPSNFRKLCMGNWGNIGDPQVYATVSLNCEKVLAYIDKVRKEQNVKLTVNHIIGRVIALTWRKYPQLNGIVARKKIYLRKDVDVFFQVSIEGAETELVGICVRKADEKGVVELAQEILDESERVRASAKHPTRKAQKSFRYIPWRLIPYSVGLLNWLQYDRNINLAWFGIPRDVCGSVMLTSVGSLGMDAVYVPLTKIGRSPCQIAIGKVYKKPVVVDDQVVVGQCLELGCTFDHRFIDGLLASRMAKMITTLVENIDQYYDLFEGKVNVADFTFPR